jgi:hypothetical protein
MIGSDFETGSLGHPPPVEEEPDDPTADIVDVLADAEQIVQEAEASVIADLDRAQRKQPWWRRRHRGSDDDFGLSNR